MDTFSVRQVYGSYGLRNLTLPDLQFWRRKVPATFPVLPNLEVWHVDEAVSEDSTNPSEDGEHVDEAVSEYSPNPSEDGELRLLALEGPAAGKDVRQEDSPPPPDGELRDHDKDGGVRREESPVKDVRPFALEEGNVQGNVTLDPDDYVSLPVRTPPRMGNFVIMSRSGLRMCASLRLRRGPA